MAVLNKIYENIKKQKFTDIHRYMRNKLEIL